MLQPVPAPPPEPAPRAPFVDDLPPAPGVAPPGARTAVVEMKLAEDQAVKAVGVVYGIEHRISGPGYAATLFLDRYNQRIKYVSYEGPDLTALVLRVRWLAEANGLDKIVCPASRVDFQKFLAHGYVLEAVIRYYLNGEDAYVMSKFRSQARLTAPTLMEEILLIERIMAEEPPATPAPLPAGVRLRAARRDDIPELVALYKRIFATYPSPLLHRSYLEAVFEHESVFAVAEQDGAIVAAASAELHPERLAAELTDCATRPEARGRGLMSHVLAMLEDELRRRRYVCAYTMARARSFGMNRVFRHLRYEFQGRLVNNCDIFGSFEDMNIWVKDLRAPPPRAA